MNDHQQLVRKYCQEGDHSAFRTFYRAQATRLWRFLIARGCDRDSAYDLLSEAFLKFIQSVCKDPSSPVAFLYRIAINLHIDSYRRSQASPIDAAVDAGDAEPLADETPDEHSHVRTLVRNLPENEQNLVLMRYWIGMTHKEVAKVLDMPEGTVRRRCAETLKKVRDNWEQE